MIACRYMEVGADNLATMTGAGISMLWPPALPAPVGFVLAVRLLAAATEFDGEEHTSTIRVRDPNDAVVFDQPNTAYGNPSPDVSNEWLNGFIIGHAVEFTASDEGTFSVSYEIDGDSASFPLHVRVRPDVGT